MNYEYLYWSIGGLVTLLALVSLYYFSVHCHNPVQKN